MTLLEKEWFIKAPWGKMCVIAWGNCLDPPVLLCHGQVDSVVSFRPLLKHLPTNFYYIGIEIPGNGKSDPFPPGLTINAHDMAYAIVVVANHFRWKNFIYMAHSLGTLLGKIYNLSYPGRISKVIELEPTPVYDLVDSEDFQKWYRHYFEKYYKKYHIYNSSKETAPKYTRQKAIDMLKRNRSLPEDIAVDILERLSEPLEGDNIRFTYDQRTKIVTRPPFYPFLTQNLYTKITTPTLAVVADNSINLGFYDKTPFALDEKAHAARNYRVRFVKGKHDVHVAHPERVAPFVSQFLVHGLEGLDTKAKL